MDIGGRVAIFKHEVCFAEALLDVPAPIYFGFSRVVRIEGEVALRPDLDAFRAECFFLIEYERKSLVVNGDES